uniref:Uncharacterized protein n=1 Tax=Tanacetum cinerariifolium TaxID=118510 RepID=A0A699GFQ0_TANCI|nr:hypothetical protein [Tanacetum cinerariifolium]
MITWFCARAPGGRPAVVTSQGARPDTCSSWSFAVFAGQGADRDPYLSSLCVENGLHVADDGGAVAGGSRAGQRAPVAAGPAGHAGQPRPVPARRRVRAGAGVFHGRAGHVPAHPGARGHPHHLAAHPAVVPAGLLPVQPVGVDVACLAIRAAGHHGVRAGRCGRAAGQAGRVHVGRFEHAGKAPDDRRRWRGRARMPGAGRRRGRLPPVPRGGLRARGRRTAQRAGSHGDRRRQLFRTRGVPDPGRCAAAELPDLRRRFRPEPVPRHRQARLRPGGQHRDRARRHAGDAGGGAGYPPGGRRPRVLPAGAGGARQPAIQGAQVSQHAGRRRARWPAHLGGAGRSARDPHRPLAAQAAHRRAAADAQRVQGRDEFCRAASRAGLLCRATQPRHRLLQRAARDQARHHRTGAGALRVWRLGGGCDQKAPVRPVLRQEQQPVSRPADPDRHVGIGRLPRRGGAGVPGAGRLRSVCRVGRTYRIAPPRRRRRAPFSRICAGRAGDGHVGARRGGGGRRRSAPGAADRRTRGAAHGRLAATADPSEQRRRAAPALDRGAMAAGGVAAGCHGGAVGRRRHGHGAAAGAGRGGLAAGRAGVPRGARVGALGHQARVPGHGGAVCLRLLPVCRRLAVSPRAGRDLGRARHRQCAERTARGGGVAAQSRLGQPPAIVAPDDVSFGGAAGSRRLPDGDGGQRVVSALGGRAVGTGDAGGVPVRRGAAAGGAAVFRRRTGAPESLRAGGTGGKSGRGVVAVVRRRVVPARRGLEHDIAGRARSAGRRIVPADERAPLGDRGRRLARAPRRLRAAAHAAVVCGRDVGLAGGAAAAGGPVVRLREPGAAAHPGAGGLGSARRAEDRRPPGCHHAGAPGVGRQPGRRPPVRVVQSLVRLCRPRPEKPGVSTGAAAGQRRTPQGQSPLPGRYGGHLAPLAGQDAAAAAQTGTRRRTRSGRAARPRTRAAARAGRLPRHGAAAGADAGRRPRDGAGASAAARARAGPPGAQRGRGHARRRQRGRAAAVRAGGGGDRGAGQRLRHDRAIRARAPVPAVRHHQAGRHGDRRIRKPPVPAGAGRTAGCGKPAAPAGGGGRSRAADAAALVPGRLRGGDGARPRVGAGAAAAPPAGGGHHGPGPAARRRRRQRGPGVAAADAGCRPGPQGDRPVGQPRTCQRAQGHRHGRLRLSPEAARRRYPDPGDRARVLPARDTAGKPAHAADRSRLAAGRHHHPRSGHAQVVPQRGKGGAVECLGDAAGRIGQRQGAGGARFARAGRPPRQALRGDQLRRHSRTAARERIVRPREGRVHGRPAADHRQAGTGARRHVFPRRDRRHGAAAAGQAAALFAGAHDRAGGRQAGDRHRCADRVRHPPGPQGAGRRRALPRGPVLPAQRDRAGDTAAAPARGRRGAAGPPFQAPVLRQRKARGAGVRRRRHGGARGACVARQCARTGKLHPPRGGDGRRRANHGGGPGPRRGGRSARAGRKSQPAPGAGRGRVPGGDQGPGAGGRQHPQGRRAAGRQPPHAVRPDEPPRIEIISFSPAIGRRRPAGFSGPAAETPCRRPGGRWRAPCRSPSCAHTAGRDCNGRWDWPAPARRRVRAVRARRPAGPRPAGSCRTACAPWRRWDENALPVRNSSRWCSVRRAACGCGRAAPVSTSPPAPGGGSESGRACSRCRRRAGLTRP